MATKMTEEEKAAIREEERREAARERGEPEAPAAEAEPAQRDTKPSNTGRGSRQGATSQPSQALAERPQQAPEQQRPRNAVEALSQMLTRKSGDLARWACGRVAPEALIRFALFDYQRSPQLQRCSPASIYLALIACAQVGLEPGGVRQHAFIVPYGAQAQFQIGYRGIIELARRSGMVRRVVGNIVYAEDEFDYEEGSGAFVHHKRALDERGEIRCAYAYAVLTNGEIEVEVMPLADLEKIKKHAERKRPSAAYTDWLDQMWRKAPIRRLGKRLPLDRVYDLAIRVDGAAEAGDMLDYRDALAEGGGDVPEIEPEDAPADEPARGVAGVRDRLKGDAA